MIEAKRLNRSDEQKVVPIKQSKRFLRSNVSLHDRYQIESIFDYSLLESKGVLANHDTVYRSDTYFFIPPEIGLSYSQNNFKDKFYDEILRPLIRLREPKLTYEELTNDAINNRLSLLGRIVNNLVILKAQVSKKTYRETVEQLKLFTCVFTGHLLKSTRKIKKKSKKVQPVGDEASNAINLSNDIEKFLDESLVLMSRIRNLHSYLEGGDPQTSSAILQEIGFCEEYCSYVFRDCLTWIKTTIAKTSHLNDFSPLEDRLISILKSEKSYYLASEMIWVNATSTEDERENYLLRRRFLKKHMWSILFLDLRKNASLKFKQQFGAMLAAGLAMVIYVTIEIYIITQSALNLSRLDFLNMSTVIGLIAFVFAYILKDRIKDLGKNKFSKGVFNRVPDNYERIEYTGIRGKTIKLGSILENLDFINFNDLPKQFQNSIKNNSQFSSQYLKKYCQIIRYRKRIRLRKSQLKQLRHNFKRIHDITRLNFQSFLRHLDESIQEHSLVNVNGDIENIKLPKNYHINLLMDHSLIQNRQSVPLKIQQLRLKLNREGLVKIDKISS